MTDDVNALQYLSKAEGLSSKELAQQADFAISAIRAYETGARKISEQQAERLGRFLKFQQNPCCACNYKLPE